jgi:hypothetical protein
MPRKKNSPPKFFEAMTVADLIVILPVNMIFLRLRTAANTGFLKLFRAFRASDSSI